MANGKINGRGTMNELQQAVEIDQAIAKKLENMPVSGLMNMSQKVYVGMLNAPNCPVFIKSRAEEGLSNLNDEADLISSLIKRMQIAFPDMAKEIPHQAKLAINVIRFIILARYHKVAELVTEFHFHRFNEDHGLEIEGMLNLLGAKRDKSMIEQWLYSKVESSLVLR
jgi:hypothetical protein